MNKALFSALLCKRNTDADSSEHHRKQVKLLPGLFPLVPFKFPVFFAFTVKTELKYWQIVHKKNHEQYNFSSYLVTLTINAQTDMN